MNPQEIQQAAYDSVWEDPHPTDKKRTEFVRSTIRDIISNRNPDRILDVGCGDGKILAPFASKTELYGCDVSQTALNKAKYNSDYKFCIQNSSEVLPFDANTFSCVFTGETIEHVVDTDLFLSEINRVMKHNGVLVMTFPSIRSVIGIIMLLLGRPPRLSARYRSPHYRDFTKWTMKKALVNNGFKPVSWRGADFGTYFIPSWSGSIVVVARKVSNAQYDPANSIQWAL